MPTRKKKGEAKKAGTSKAKGGTRSSFGTRPVKLERGLTSSDYPTSTSSEGLEVDEEEIFFDATDIQTKVCAPALATSGNMTESKGQRSCSRVAEIGHDPEKTRTPNFPKYLSRTTRYSVGIQTVPLKTNDRGIDNIVETLQWGVTDPETETEITYLEKSSSGEEEYEDARENVTDYAPCRQKAGWEQVRSGVKNRDCRDQMVQVSCPKNQTRQQKDSDLASRIDTNGYENHTRQEGEKRYPDYPCCSCLLTVLYWLALMLFVSLLLSLFFTIFLLFSRNHGLGIGPGLLYSDVEHIRNQVDSYLDLRHKASPPT